VETIVIVLQSVEIFFLWLNEPVLNESGLSRLWEIELFLTAIQESNKGIRLNIHCIIKSIPTIQP
jgi:hypothetical protein